MDWTLDQFQTYQSIAKDSPDDLESKDPIFYDYWQSRNYSSNGSIPDCQDATNKYKPEVYMPDDVNISVVTTEDSTQEDYLETCLFALNNVTLEDCSNVKEEFQYCHNYRNENDGFVNVNFDERRDNLFSNHNEPSGPEKEELISLEDLIIDQVENATNSTSKFNFSHDKNNLKLPIIQSKHCDESNDPRANASKTNKRNVFQKTVHFSLQNNSGSILQELGDDIKDGMSKNKKVNKTKSFTSNSFPKLTSRGLHDKVKNDNTKNDYYKSRRKCNRIPSVINDKKMRSIDFPLGKDYITKKIHNGVWISHPGIPLRVFLRNEQTKAEREKKQKIQDKHEELLNLKTNASLVSVKISKSGMEYKSEGGKKRKRGFKNVATTSLLSVRLSKTLRQNRH